MSFMSIVTLVATGILLWGISQSLLLEGKVRSVLNVVVVAVIGWLLFGAGVLESAEVIRVPAASQPSCGVPLVSLFLTAPGFHQP